jgi:hypothetical protein
MIFTYKLMKNNVVRLTEEQSRSIDTFTNVIRQLGEREGCPGRCSDSPVTFEIEKMSFGSASKDETKRYRLDKDGRLTEET